MGTKKKQHYTPNLILQSFADEDSHRLWVWDKEQESCRPVRGVRSKGGKRRYKAFAENHYYTIVDAGGNRDLSVDDYLTGIETAAAPVIADVIDVVEHGIYPSLGFARFEELARFLWAQNTRSPYIRSESINSKESRQMFQELALEVAGLLGVDRALLVIKHGDASTALEAASKHAIIIEEYPGCAVDCMRRMSLDLVKIAPTVSAHFVTSDRPCLISPVLQPGGMAFMALTKEVAVKLSRPQDSYGELRQIGSDAVETLNKRTFETAMRFVAGPSHDYLEKLARS